MFTPKSVLTSVNSNLSVGTFSKVLQRLQAENFFAYSECRSHELVTLTAAPFPGDKFAIGKRFTMFPFQVLDPTPPLRSGKCG